MKKTRLTPIVLLAALTAFAADAAEISNLTAGKLAETEIDPAETTLTIQGSMNAADFAYIFDNLNALATLNLYDANIVAYSGEALPYTGLKSSPANTLPDYALTGLSKLTSVTLPSTLKAIGKGSLSGTGIKRLDVPPMVTTIGDYAAMRCPDLKEVIIPKSVSTIGTRAFAYCPKLETVDINASLTSIPEGLFEACGGLRTLSLSALTGCTNIGPWAVAECQGLSTLVLPASSEVLEKGAAYGTSGIQTLELPESLDYIEDNAMSAMTSLKTLNASKVNYVPKLGQNVFSRLDQSKVTLITPNDQVQDYKDSDQWNQFKIISEKDYQSSANPMVASNMGETGLKVTVADGKIMINAGAPMGNIAVFDVSGRRIVSASAELNAEIPIQGWAKGVYLVATQLGAAKITI